MILHSLCTLTLVLSTRGTEISTIEPQLDTIAPVTTDEGNDFSVGMTDLLTISTATGNLKPVSTGMAPSVNLVNPQPWSLEAANIRKSPSTAKPTYFLSATQYTTPTPLPSRPDWKPKEWVEYFREKHPNFWFEEQLRKQINATTTPQPETTNPTETATKEASSDADEVMSTTPSQFEDESWQSWSDEKWIAWSQSKEYKDKFLNVLNPYTLPSDKTKPTPPSPLSSKGDTPPSSPSRTTGSIHVLGTATKSPTKDPHYIYSNNRGSPRTPRPDTFKVGSNGHVVNVPGSGGIGTSRYSKPKDPSRSPVGPVDPALLLIRSSLEELQKDKVEESKADGDKNNSTVVNVSLNKNDPKAESTGNVPRPVPQDQEFIPYPYSTTSSTTQSTDATTSTVTSRMAYIESDATRSSTAPTPAVGTTTTAERNVFVDVDPSEMTADEDVVYESEQNVFIAFEQGESAKSKEVEDEENASGESPSNANCRHEDGCFPIDMFLNDKEAFQTAERRNEDSSKVNGHDSIESEPIALTATTTTATTTVRMTTTKHRLVASPIFSELEAESAALDSEQPQLPAFNAPPLTTTQQPTATSNWRSTIPPYLIPLGPNGLPLLNPDGSPAATAVQRPEDNPGLLGTNANNRQTQTFVLTPSPQDLSAEASLPPASTPASAASHNHDAADDSMTRLMNMVHDMPMQTRRRMMAHMVMGVPMTALALAATGFPTLLIAPMAMAIPGFLMAAFTETEPVHHHFPDNPPPRRGIGALMHAIRNFHDSQSHGQTNTTVIELNLGNGHRRGQNGHAPANGHHHHG